MKKTVYSLVVLLALLTIPSGELLCCTNVLVTRGASIDGSCMVTYAADSHTLFGELYFKPASDWAKGSKLDVINWDGGNYIGQIDQIPHTYQTVGNMNQYQVIITETTFGGLKLANKNGLIDYGSLIYITLQRAKSAREAIGIMTSLTQQYGYCSSGETFSIADKNECWIMEMVGKGDELGTVWVAIRIPDGYISAHANQSRIHKIPFGDKENCLYAKDVVSFAREKGLYTGSDEDFSFCDTYNPLDFSGMRGCEGRTWSAFNILGGGKFVWEDANGTMHTEKAEDYLDFAMGYNPDHKMPLYIKPAEKVTLPALANVMRDHYEGTPMDMTEDSGAGVSRLPYRWRPMNYTIDGTTYVHERAIATQQTGFWLLGQARNWLPDEVGGIEWFGVDDAGTSALTPMYTNISAVPEWFAPGNGSMVEYSPTSAFWQVNKVTHFAYLFYDRVAPVIREEIEKHQNNCLEQVAKTDAEAVKMLNAGNTKNAISLLTETSNKLAESMFNRWKELENELLVKYMDGNIKKENEDGSLYTRPGTTIPGIEQPAQREIWLRSIINDKGEVLKVVEPKK